MNRRVFTLQALAGGAYSRALLKVNALKALTNLTMDTVKNDPDAPPAFSFSFRAADSQNILLDRDIWVFSGDTMTNISREDITEVQKFLSPPYASSDFRFTVGLGETPIRAKSTVVYPREIHREGNSGSLRVSSVVLPLADRHAILMRLKLTNESNKSLQVPLRLFPWGSIDRPEPYQFAMGFPNTVADRPGLRRWPYTDYPNEPLYSNESTGNVLIFRRADGLGWAVGTTLAVQPRLMTAQFSLSAKESKTLNFVLALGEENLYSDVDKLLANFEKEFDAQRQRDEKLLSDAFGRFPILETADARLSGFYKRGILTLLLSQWDTRFFVTQPFYSTSSLGGRYLVSYIWDAAYYTARPLCMYDPYTVRKLIRYFLLANPMKSFAIRPTDGSPYHHYYAYSTYALIYLIYTYVSFTGDLTVLTECYGDKDVVGDRIEEKRVIDWLKDFARFGEHNGTPYLVNYGSNRELLELLLGSYDGIVPSPNGERCGIYQMVSELSALIGETLPTFRQNAEMLRDTLVRELWQSKEGWFGLIDSQGAKRVVYTIQIFELLQTKMLPSSISDAMVSHLNEEEFLSEYGVHSISKRDPIYDPLDGNWGGPALYAGAGPQLATILYQAGYAREAEEVLRRILWWGERFPYYPQCIYADHAAYRYDGAAINISGSSTVDPIIYGIFGIEPQVDGTLVINPKPGMLGRGASLRNVLIRGRRIDVFLNANRYELRVDGKPIAYPSYGRSFLLGPH